MAADDKLNLSEAERNSPLWQKIMTWQQNRLERCRMRNDAVTLTPEKTSVLRGRICEIKLFLAQNDPRSVPPEAGDTE